MTPKPSKSPLKSPITVKSPRGLGDDDSKEIFPEVLDRARGQSVQQSVPENDSKYKGELVEYIFANKKLKSIVPKMEYSKYEKNVSKPSLGLALEHVIGYMGHDNLCRNNLYSLKKQSGSILAYNVGCIGVIHDLSTNEQTLYQDHCCPITSITVHPKINYVATASLKSPLSSTTPVIRVWDPTNLDSLPEIKCNALIGEVRNLTFSPISTLLFLTCGLDKKNTTMMAFKLQQ
eukprot:196336_1